MPRRTHRPANAFTLIEMIVVIAIIAILAVLLIPTVNKARLTSQRAKAAHEVSQISTALRSYLDEYGRPFGNIAGHVPWPANEKDVEKTVNGIEIRNPLVIMLAGGKGVLAGKTYNPKQLPFLSLDTNSLDKAGQYVDPWGNPYKCMLDYNSDGKIDIKFSNGNGATNLSNVRVAVWSRGPNKSDEKTDNNWADDIRNW